MNEIQIIECETIQPHAESHESPTEELMRCLHSDVWPQVAVCRLFGIYNNNAYAAAQHLVKQGFVSKDNVLSIEGHPEQWESFIANARLSNFTGAFSP